MNIHTNTYKCIGIHIYIYMHTYTHKHIHVYTYTYIHVYIYTHICTAYALVFGLWGIYIYKLHTGM